MTTNKLAVDDYLPHAPQQVGEQIKIHHCKQGKGNDRLYVKRTDDGAVVAYCHHCGKHGATRQTGLRYLEAEAGTDKPARDSNIVSGASQRNNQSVDKGTAYGRGNNFLGSPFYLPNDIEPLGTGTPQEATKWLSQYEITANDAMQYGICWSPSKGLIFPKISNGILVSYQARKFPSDPDWPKYVTYRAQNAPKTDCDALGATNAVCLVVEDYLSAYKASTASYAAVPLFGTHLHEPSRLHQYSAVLVWLDNDNPQVRASSIRIHNSLLLEGINSGIIWRYSDPKHYRINKIQDIVSTCLASFTN